MPLWHQGWRSFHWLHCTTIHWVTLYNYCSLSTKTEVFFFLAVSFRNVCYKVTSTKCSKDLHYDNTFVPTEDQRASEFTLLQPIIDSGCSPDIEKYLCQTRMPPCTADTTVVHMPCREFCKRINRDCGDVFKANSIPVLHCDYLFPQGDSSNGLCDIKRWPAPWPWKIADPDIPVSGNQMKTLVC